MPVFNVEYTTSALHSVNIEADDEEHALKLAAEYAWIDHGSIIESHATQVKDDDTVHYPWDRARA